MKRVYCKILVYHIIHLKAVQPSEALPLPYLFSAKKRDAVYENVITNDVVLAQFVIA